MIKYLKYAVFIFVAGALFTLGSSLAMIYVFPLLGGGVDVHGTTISEMESELGKPCSEIFPEATQFVRDDLKEIIDVGLSGGDWIAGITKEQKEFIDLTDERVTKCSILDFSASQKGIKWPDFSELREIFSTLEMHTTSYNGEPVSSKGLNKSAVERLIKNREGLIQRLDG